VGADVAVFTGFLACCVGLTAGGGVCEADLTGGMDETEEEEEEGCVADGGAAEEDGWEGFCDAFTDGTGAAAEGAGRAIAAADWGCDAADDVEGGSATAMEAKWAERSAVCVGFFAAVFCGVAAEGSDDVGRPPAFFSVPFALTD
jgi:hypothetical protein